MGGNFSGRRPAGEGYEAIHDVDVRSNLDGVGERTALTGLRGDDRVCEVEDVATDFRRHGHRLPAGSREVPAVDQELQRQDTGREASGHVPLTAFDGALKSASVPSLQ